MLYYRHGMGNQNNKKGRIKMEFKAKAKVFGKIKKHKFYVVDGIVRVWDDVAGYYTTCHSMSKKSMNRICKLATN